MDSVAAASMTRISGLAQPDGYCSQPAPNQAQAAATATNSNRPTSTSSRSGHWLQRSTGNAPARRSRTMPEASKAPAWKAPPGEAAPRQST